MSVIYAEECPKGWAHRGEFEFYPNKCFNQDLILMSDAIIISLQLCLWCFSTYTIFFRNRQWWSTTFFPNSHSSSAYSEPKFRIRPDKSLLLALVQILIMISSTFAIATTCLRAHLRISYADKNVTVTIGIIIAEGSFHILVPTILYLLSSIFVTMISAPILVKIQAAARKFAVFMWIFAIVMFTRTVIVFTLPHYIPGFPTAYVWWLSMAIYCAIAAITFGVFGATVVKFMRKDANNIHSRQAIKKVMLINVAGMCCGLFVVIISILQLFVLDNNAVFLQHAFIYSAGVVVCAVGLYVHTWQKRAVSVKPISVNSKNSKNSNNSNNSNNALNSNIETGTEMQ